MEFWFSIRVQNMAVPERLSHSSTYVGCARSCGLSDASGYTGCGGSPIGTHPSDLLMAWLSFLAGDFCEWHRHKDKARHTNAV